MLFAGAARRSITPYGTVDLSGYAARTQPCTGVLDDLYVRALVLRQEEQTAIVCSLDILGLEQQHVRELRAELARDGFRPETTLFCCTHTHGAPAVQRLRGCGTPSAEYVEMVLRETLHCVREAAGGPLECEILAGSGSCDLNVNRRRRDGSGIALAANPEGPRDPVVTVLQVRKRGGGEIIGTIFNYACHAVTLGGDNRLVTGDWPGEVCRRLEAESKGVALFLQGCCGDLNPRVRGGIPELKRAAALVGQSVLDAVDGAERLEEPRISAWLAPVPLPLMPNPPDDEIIARLLQIRSKPPEARDFADTRDLDWGADVLANPQQARQSEMVIEVGELSLGQAAIAWLPGEAFCEIGLALRRLHPGKCLLVAGYTNGNIGYIPTGKAFQEGGYEVTDAWRYYGYQMVGPESERLILDAFAAHATSPI
ncbi:MAG: alkaline ceramidase [Armatimonadota bacterium]|nr:MAG: alkaline ceramidase [Armatimonadota bacterium]